MTVKDEGAMATSALASADAHSTLCPKKGGTYSRIEMRPTARMRRTAAPVVIEDLTPPQKFRTSPGRPWVTKAPIAVRLGAKPVDVSVMDAGGSKVGLVYDDWPTHPSPEAAYQRIRFAPCEGDPAAPTWYGWPGSIVADRENVCVDLAVREEGELLSLDRVSLGNGCKSKPG